MTTNDMERCRHLVDSPPASWQVSEDREMCYRVAVWCERVTVAVIWLVAVALAVGAAAWLWSQWGVWRAMQ